MPTKTEKRKAAKEAALAHVAKVEAQEASAQAADPVEGEGPTNGPEPAELYEDGQKVVYSEIRTARHIGDDPITVDLAKKLMGWVSETDYAAKANEGKPESERKEVEFGSVFALQDREGNKVRCEANLRNRPIYTGVYERLVQEILMRKWRCNGEPIIMGRYGHVLNGQHTLIALILAEQDRQGLLRPDPKKTPDDLRKEAEGRADYWREQFGWTGPVTLEKLVVVGIAEDDDTVNTMDTCKPRSLADVIYRSEFFASLEPKAREKASNALGKALKLLWDRTDAATRGERVVLNTHSEALDFAMRHPRLLAAVQHIITENSGGKLSELGIGPGHWAGLMYLMAASKSDGDAYRNLDPAPSEQAVDFSNWKAASEFFVLLRTEKETALAPLRDCLRAMADPKSLPGEKPRPGRKLTEATVAIAKAWAAFLADEDVTADTVTLEYVEDDEHPGVLILDDFDDFGGIDTGLPVPEVQPSPEEIAERKERLKQESIARLKMANEKRLAAKKAKADAAAAAVTAPPADGEGKTPPTKSVQPIRVRKKSERAQIQEENTRQAAEADAKLASERVGVDEEE